MTYTEIRKQIESMSLEDIKTRLAGYMAADKTVVWHSLLRTEKRRW